MKITALLLIAFVIGWMINRDRNEDVAIWPLIVALVCVLFLSGCSTLMPDAIPLEVAHVSHASQHFGDHPTNYGYDAAYVGLKWKRGNFSVKVEEGYVFGRLDGMHEVTQGNIEYDIPLHR